MRTIIKIKTYRCACGYGQDFEPTQENQEKHFNADPKFKISNLGANQCPSCALKGILSALSLETDDSKKTIITIMGKDEVDTLEKKDEITKEKRPLTQPEKDEMRAKIQADITRFNAMQ